MKINIRMVCCIKNWLKYRFVMIKRTLSELNEINFEILDEQQEDGQILLNIVVCFSFLLIESHMLRKLCWDTNGIHQKIKQNRQTNKQTKHKQKRNALN